MLVTFGSKTWLFLFRAQTKTMTATISNQYRCQCLAGAAGAPLSIRVAIRPTLSIPEKLSWSVAAYKHSEGWAYFDGIAPLHEHTVIFNPLTPTVAILVQL